MAIEEHFDVSQIVGIKFYPESNTYYNWVDAEPEARTFFGLIKVRSAIPAGFTDPTSIFDNRYSEDELKNYGYNVYSTDERVSNHRVCNKPHVIVYLTHKLQVSKKFDTDALAKKWIYELKAKSAKSFEIITIQ